MKSPGERLRQKRKDAGLTGAELGIRAAMVLGRDKALSESAVRNHENGTNGIPQPVAEAYAKVLRTTAQWLLFGDAGQRTVADNQLRQVPLVGAVQAGQWNYVVDEPPEPDELISVSLPQYERAQLYALRVVGRSMDREYPDGSVVIVCPAAEIGVKEGDHVIVRRRRNGEVETTIKEIVLERGGIALWPRSTDPAHQAPIRLQAVRDADDGPEIIGVVVASQRVRPPRAGPLITF